MDCKMSKEIHAPWCPACKQIQADWEDLGKSGRELGIHVGKIDVTREPGTCRQMHSYLTETLGIPAWGSYIIFAVATLVAGLILGLFLVLIADCICPPKRQQNEVTEIVEGEDEDSEELDRREQDPSEWETHGSGAEDENYILSAKPSGDESAFEDDQPASDSDTDGGLRKRIINEDC
ncbi:thioredoxin-related transmembrane protein 4-like [Rhincodon typus]|uniref:thioredoxin-related transmembrane protein 4-like n=1 Tax=Rhincodon typus TaxID=259920 RepID=UPI00202E1373|nr:thioredoxin-related transmembrane protein 4-like [Rhincodon typus]